MLVNGGLQMESPDAEGRQVMHWAAINENTSVLDALLSACIGYDDLLASLLSQADSHGLSPMHWAVYHGNTAAARMLIVAGAQVAAPDGEGKTALHWTSQNGTRDCADLVLAADPTVVNAKDNAQRTALHMAIGEQNLEVMRGILAAPGCDPSLGDEAGRTPLHWTVTMGLLDLVEALIDGSNSAGNNAVPDIAKADGHGATPLHYAAQHDQVDIIDALLKHGPPDLHSVVDADGRGPLMWAISQGHLNAINALLTAGADPMLADNDGRTALHAAAFVDNGGVVEALLDSGKCEVDAPDAATGQTALIAASELGATQSVAALVAGHANVFASDAELKCALHHAAIGGHVEVLGVLLAPLDGGGDQQRTWPNPIDERGETPLHYACFYGHAEAVSLLVAEPDIQFDCQDYDGVSPLHWAALQGHYRAVELMLAAGCYPNFQELRAEMPTPLDYAEQLDDPALAELLASYGAVSSLVIQDHAATTIQAAARGFFARKLVRKLRAGKELAEAAAPLTSETKVHDLGIDAESIKESDNDASTKEDSDDNSNNGDNSAGTAAPAATPAAVNVPEPAPDVNAAEKDPSEWGLATLEMHVRMSMESLVSKTSVSGTSGGNSIQPPQELVTGVTAAAAAAVEVHAQEHSDADADTDADASSGTESTVIAESSTPSDATTLIAAGTTSRQLEAGYPQPTSFETVDIDARVAAAESAVKAAAADDEQEAPMQKNASVDVEVKDTMEKKKTKTRNSKKPWERDPLLLTKRKPSVADLDDALDNDAESKGTRGSSQLSQKTALFNRSAGKVTLNAGGDDMIKPTRSRRTTGLAFGTGAVTQQETSRGPRDSLKVAKRRGKRPRPGATVSTSISTDWMKGTHAGQEKLVADARQRTAELEAPADEEVVDIHARARLRAHSALHFRKVLEGERVRHVRNYIRAAITIQRAYRAHLAWKREMGMPTGGNGLYDSYPSKQSIARARSAPAKPRPSLILNALSPRYDKHGRKVKPTPNISDRKLPSAANDMASFLSTPSFGVGHAENQLTKKQREIAVLVIQLWWRRAKTRKMRREKGIHHDDPALLQGPAADRFAESIELANSVRTTTVYRPKTAVTLWRPEKFAVGLSTADVSKPSAAVKSFNKAVSIFGRSRDSYNHELKKKAPSRRVASAKVSATRQQNLKQLYGTVELQGSRPKSAPVQQSPEPPQSASRTLLPKIDTPHPNRGVRIPSSKNRLARGKSAALGRGIRSSSQFDTTLDNNSFEQTSPLNARRRFATSRKGGGRVSSAPPTSRERSAAADSAVKAGESQVSTTTLRKQMRQMTSDVAQNHINRRGLGMEVGRIGLRKSPPPQQPTWSARW